MKKTNLENIKTTAKAMLYLDIVETNIPFIIKHPFFENNIQYIVDNGKYEIVNILDSEDDLEKVREFYKKRIDNCTTITEIYLMIVKCYRLTFLKFIKNDLSIEDFSEILVDAWTSSESPNNDINVSINTFIQWFKYADKKYLMEEKDYNVYLNIPDNIILYRGIGSKSNPYGLSWTDSYEKAKWFANRYNNNGYVEKINVKKEDILCYLNIRDEHEYIINIKKYKNIIEII